MTRRTRILSIVAASLAGIVVIGVVGAILVLQSSGFRNYVRDTIISTAEESTGGKVQLGSFDFDWRHLRATIRNLVIHGTEPADQAPLLRAALIQLDLKLFSGLKQAVDLQALLIDQPQANLIVYPDGRTNVPEPKVKKKSDKSALETVVDLKVGHFNLTNGLVLVNQQKTHFSARGENLTAKLAYAALNPSYQGNLSINPLYLDAGRNSPLNLNVNLPVVIEKDRVQLNQAKIASGASNIDIDGAIEHLAAPRTNAHVIAHISPADMRKFVDLPANLRDMLNADVVVNMDENSIKLPAAHASFGASNFEASGTLKDPSGQSSVQYNASLALGELGRMFAPAQQPQGVIHASGTAKLSGQSEYLVTARIDGRELSFRNGAQQFSHIGVSGDVKADPREIALNDLDLRAFGGSVTGSGALENMRRYRFDGALHNFDTRVLARTFAGQDYPYNGIISGPVHATGDLEAKGTAGIKADAHLNIAPGTQGLPVRGKINADYNGAGDVISVADSFVALPNTRLDLSGSLDRQIDIKLVSHNLADLQPVAGKAPIPVKIQPGGAIAFNGTVTGKLASPHIAGHLQANKFAVQDRAFDQLSLDASAQSSGARVDNGSLTQGRALVAFSGAVGLKNWKPENNQLLSANANIRDANLADLIAIAGQKDLKVSGVVNATANVNGTIGNPQGLANLAVVNGSYNDEHFDRLAANVTFSDQLIQLTNTQLTAGTARIDANATYRHAKDTYTNGTLQAHVASNTMQIDQFNAVRQQTKGLKGTVQLNADIGAKVEEVNKQTEFLLTQVNANASAHGLVFEGKPMGDLTATAQTSGNTVNYNLTSDFAGSTIKATGATQLTRDYPTTASATMANLPIEQVLAIADRRDINAKGNLSGAVQFSGTMQDPHASADVSIAKAVIYDEPLDRVQARATYTNQRVDIQNLEVSENGAQVQATGWFEHPANDFEQGRLQFHVNSNSVQLAKLHIVQAQRPGLTGTLTLNAEGAGTLQKVPQGSTAPPVLFSSLNADIGARGLEVNRKQLGDLTLKAQTSGSDLVFNLDSNLGQADIHGHGQTRLQSDYPTTATVSFSKLTYLGLAPLLGNTGGTATPSFDALAEGQVNVSGPATKPEQMNGSLNLAKLVVSTTPRSAPMGAGAKQIALQNEGPIVVALNNQRLDIKSAHITGHDTDINITGAVALNDKNPLNLQVTAKTDLKILQDLDRDIYSAGAVTLQAMVRGTLQQPLVTGQAHLQNASVNLVDIPNGISNANGTIVFNGTTAVIQNLTAESGGGQITAGGGVAFTNGVIRFGLRANANSVRVRSQGASIVVSSSVNVTGTTDHSLLSGSVTINRIAFNPKSDFGSILSSSAPPPQTPSAPSGALAGMKLDVRIRTAPDVALQTALAQNLQADADLTLRGTAASPGMLGRVNVTSGKLIFFGSTYDINSGSISFYNPIAIDPVLDIDLETKAQGVDVILSVSGPVNNMKLTYRSDPPLQFSEIVGLLAAGRTPTSDPTILANQPAPPPQSLEQMGESAIVSQAIAAPVADRLQRVFGVSKLKIDPTFTSGSSVPQARLTLQQQVSTNVTFTYITDVTQANSQIIRVEWALNQQWSAIATRDEYGRFGIDFFLKKQFR